MSDEPPPPSIEETIITRLLDLLNGIKWFGFLRAQQTTGINRDGGPKSSIHFAKLFRMERAIVLTKALIEVFSGRLTFAPPPAWTTVRPAPPAGASTRSPQSAPIPPSTSSGRRTRADSHPIGCSPRAIREIFSTRSIREIITHICLDLEITPHATNWPTELLTYYQTPAEWSAAHYPPDQPPDLTQDPSTALPAIPLAEPPALPPPPHPHLAIAGAHGPP